MKNLGQHIYQIVLLFLFLGVLFIPFSFSFLTFQPKVTAFLFEDLILYIASNFDSIYIANPEISSDSTTMYLLFLILLIVAILFSILLNCVYSFKKTQQFFTQIIPSILVIYLSVVMLKYGFNKIFKVQFYLPEPNTLFTPLGLMDKDILYWSTIGSSYSYSFFLGLLEVIPAILLLFRRTRTFGNFILFGILIHVVAINFCYDISVKLYSSFLLMISISLLIPSLKTIYSFFILNQSVKLTSTSIKNSIISNNKVNVLKIILVSLIFLECLYPFIKNKVYNDDKIPRNHLHGAYEVFAVNDSYEQKRNKNIKRIFIHRQNYFIIQYEDDSMEDFKLEIDPIKNKFILTNHEGGKNIANYKYFETSKKLELSFEEINLILYTKALPWKKMPLLQPLFHWSVDEIK